MAIMAKVEKRIETKFRQAAMERYGYAKGAITHALEAAMDMWASGVHASSLKKVPIESIVGILKGTKETSTELKHKAVELFIPKQYRKK